MDKKYQSRQKENGNEKGKKRVGSRKNYKQFFMNGSKKNVDRCARKKEEGKILKLQEKSRRHNDRDINCVSSKQKYCKKKEN